LLHKGLWNCVHSCKVCSCSCGCCCSCKIALVVFDNDAFSFQILVEGLFTKIFAESGLFASTKWNCHVGLVVGIDETSSSLDLFSNFQSLGRINEDNILFSKDSLICRDVKVLDKKLNPFYNILFTLLISLVRTPDASRP